MTQAQRLSIYKSTRCLRDTCNRMMEDIIASIIEEAYEGNAVDVYMVGIEKDIRNLKETVQLNYKDSKQV